MSEKAKEAQNIKDINNKGLTGKYDKAVMKGLEKFYSEFYPQYKITIGHDNRKVSYQNAAGYVVYIDNFKKLTPERTVKEERIEVKFYPNLEAINFSIDIPVEEFYKECNDYSYDNHTELLEKLESLRTMYTLKGITFTEVRVSNHGYCVKAAKNYNPNVYTGRDLWIDGHFDRSPISKGTMNSVFNKVKKALERYESKVD